MKTPTLTSLAPQKSLDITQETSKKTRGENEMVLMNLRITAAQRKSIHQMALDLDMTAKDLIMLALDEFKDKRGYR